MPCIRKEDLEAIFPTGVTSSQFPTFVETGTCDGDTTASMAECFSKVYSIEYDKTLADLAKLRFRNQAHVEIIQGDSSHVLPRLVPQLTDPTVFFLDAHYSGGKTSHGKEKVPLLHELSVLFRLFVPAGIVVVDDARLFGVQNDGVGGDWRRITIANIVKMGGNRIRSHHTLPSHLSDTDQLVLWLHPLRR
jgi:predicted O-methyltransferase YrrM